MMDSAKIIFADFEQLNRQGGFVTEGDLVIAAVSGGADSVAMLDLLVRVNREICVFSLFAVHFDHQLRPESASEAKLVQNLCDSLNIKLYIGSGDISKVSKKNRRSEHDMGRTLRYDYLSQIALKLKKELSHDDVPRILTAHHFDDQVETVLMRLFNGSGLSGLSGIRPRMKWGTPPNINIIRPLLEFRHSQLTQYCKCRDLEFVTDPSNADLNYPRNNIRHKIVPIIEDNIGVKALRGIVRSAEIIREAEEYSQNQIDKLLAESVVNHRSCELELDYKQYSSYLKGLRLASINRIACLVADRPFRITHERCQAVEQFLSRNQGGVLEIGGGVSVTQTGDRIYFFKRPSAVKEKRLVVPGEYTIGDWGVLQLNVVDVIEVGFPPPKNTLYISWSAVDDVQLELAPVSPGDKISLLGMKGRRKVSDYLHDSGIPVYRRRYPAIWADNELVAIPPFGISDYYKISDSSLQALEIIWNDV